MVAPLVEPEKSYEMVQRMLRGAHEKERVVVVEEARGEQERWEMAQVVLGVREVVGAR